MFTYMFIYIYICTHTVADAVLPLGGHGRTPDHRQQHAENHRLRPGDVHESRG